MKRFNLILAFVLCFISANAAVKTYQWTLSGTSGDAATYDPQYQALVNGTGITVDGLTLYSTPGADVGASSHKGFQLQDYAKDEPPVYNARFLKLTLPGDTKDSLHWTIREGNTNADFAWHYYCAVLPKGTPITETTNLKTYATLMGTLLQENTKADVRADLPGFVIDLMGKDSVDVYFFHTATNKEGTAVKHSNTAWQILDLAITTQDKDANTNLTSIVCEGVSYAADAPVVYGNVANNKIRIIGAAESATAMVDTATIDAPAVGDTAIATLTVTAESGATKAYKIKVVGAIFKRTTFDYCLVGNTELQNAIMRGDDYKVLGLTMNVMVDKSDINFGDETKPGMYLRNAGETYGDCGLKIQLPPTMGFFDIQIRPGTKNLDYYFYMTTAKHGATAPTGWAASDNKVALGIAPAQTTTSISVPFFSPIYNFTDSTDAYMFNINGGLRWQYISWVAVYTELVKPTTPAFDPEGGSFPGSVNVTLTAEPGAAIYYTLDNSDPTTASSLYESAITLTATTTVKAIAVLDGVASDVVAKEFVIEPVLTLAQAAAKEANAESYVNAFNVIRVYADKYIFVEDATSPMLISKYGYGLTNGDQVAANMIVKSATADNQPKLTPVSKLADLIITPGEAPAVDTLKAAPVQADINRVIQYTNVIVVADVEWGAFGSDDIYFIAGTDTIKAMNTFGTTLSVTIDNVYDFEGAVMATADGLYFAIAAITATAERTKTTFNVVVPEGSTNCYMAASFINNWSSFHPLTKVDDTHYTISFYGDLTNGEYKYTQDADWKTVEKNAEGGDINNRKVTALTMDDTVAKWATEKTAINNVKANAQAIKRFDGNQIVFERNNARYNVLGAIVK